MSLLINEPPLQVLPSLAIAIGLNEAIVLQQLHYLLAYATVNHDGKKWVYNNYEAWQKQHFKFWSVDTIKRAFNSLQKSGLIICQKLQAKFRNQTNFYTIDYAKLSKLQTQILGNKEPSPSVQNAPMEQGNTHQSNGVSCTNPSMQNDPMTWGQNALMLQENTNRLLTREYKARECDKDPNLDQNPEIAHSHTGDFSCQLNPPQVDNPQLLQEQSFAKNQPSQNQAHSSKKQALGHVVSTNNTAKQPPVKQKPTPISQWQAPDLAIMKHHLAELGYTQEITKSQYQTMFVKFVNYYSDKEVQGFAPMGDKVKLDKWASWIIRERPISTANTHQQDIVHQTVPSELKFAPYKQKTHEQIVAENVKKMMDARDKAIAMGRKPLPLRLLPEQEAIYRKYYGIAS